MVCDLRVDVAKVPVAEMYGQRGALLVVGDVMIVQQAVVVLQFPDALRGEPPHRLDVAQPVVPV